MKKIASGETESRIAKEYSSRLERSKLKTCAQGVSVKLFDSSQVNLLCCINYTLSHDFLCL